MSGQMLPDSEWNRNVGTPSYPVSFIHEYAVGLLWDALHYDDEVRVRTMDGSMSGNLKDGTDRVIIPDAMQPIGGCIPDLALLDKDLRPVRVLEVVVTSAPTPDKMKKLEKLESRGVDVVLVPVRSEEELKGLVPSSSDTVKPKWAYRWNHKILEQNGITNIPRQQVIIRNQRQADSKIENLIEALTQCRPEFRKQLINLLQEMDGLESRYPLSPQNPKRFSDTS